MNDDFCNKIFKLHGEAGKQWLKSIPEIIKKYQEKWKIKVYPPFELSYNYVCPAETFGGEKVVLKLAFPGDNEFKLELEALKRFSSEVSIQIIGEDADHGALLLERAMPGLPISGVKVDEDQIHLAAQVISQLHKPIDNDSISIFPSVSDWAKAFERYKQKYPTNSGPVPNKIFDLGEKIFSELLKDKKEQVLLHGDLHNDNIISSERGWLVIDPKGVVGEREFELGAYLRNPYYDLPKGSNYKKLQIRRIIQFSEELGFDKHRVHHWATGCAVISLLWFLEDEGELKSIYIENVKLLNSLKV
ncbi:MAG: phosphotransferase [Candidatus Pacebacteria bacterium]|jgi:streptomycin 6-kinase|nr:phosphotransferase [Candidatus Paceibacterota bacterium]MBT3511874.1 phosphotransferase [Candidatus Paceibacterota bacterium]MBT4005361.1 phosphotransferase [Candidatus Paceibacterota bacterium]MBT4359272.1 phosphotransferase [Candidatus Paceibacterota bacterium]MBT4680893.1 phosphotransferase [Candidatus Paceibacterota bacterium]